MELDLSVQWYAFVAGRKRKSWGVKRGILEYCQSLLECSHQVHTADRPGRRRDVGLSCRNAMLH